MNLRELLVGRRGEAPLVPPYILSSFKKALALPELWNHSSSETSAVFDSNSIPNRWRNPARQRLSTIA